MIAIYLRYVIDGYKVAEFEHFAQLGRDLVERFGGAHHGYYLPAEGASNVAVGLFSFPSLAAYEDYRQRSLDDDGYKEATAYADQTRCILSYERSFMRPLPPPPS